MVDENRPTGEAAGEPSDSRYFGPFSEPPRSALSSEASYDPIPTFGSVELAAAKWRAGASCGPTWQRTLFGDDGDPALGAYGSPSTFGIGDSGSCSHGTRDRHGCRLWRRYSRSPDRPLRCYDGQSFGTNPPRRNPRSGATTADECQHC